MGKPGTPSRLTLIGGYYPGAPYILQYWWHTSNDMNLAFWSAYWRIISATPTSFWNAVADIPVIQYQTGLTYANYRRIEDPMLMHALLYSEWRHSLEFVTSTHGQHVKVKHKMAENMVEYHAGDLAETLVCHQALAKEMSNDPGSTQVYQEQSLPLIPIILNSSHTRGIRIDQHAVVDSIRVYQGLVNDAFDLARVACGYAINLRSESQVKEYLYVIAGHQAQKSGKRKAAGAGKSSGLSSDQDAINALRMAVLPFDADYENGEGLSLEYILQRIDEGADMFLEAMALHTYAFATMNTYLYGLCKSVYELVEPDEEARKRKAKKARKDLRSRTVTIEDVCERVYPDVSQHTQANGRWSWTDPPMTGVPKSLHHIFIPDPGTAWLVYDYKRMEPTIDAYLCNDVATQEAIEGGRDIYKEGTIETFGRYSDPLKKVFKAVKLSLSYGKDPHNLHKIPNIMNYGLSKEQLTKAAYNYLAAHPGKTQWMARKKRDIKATQGSRTPFGRLRWLMAHTHDMEKEGLNHPMQATATDITNLTIIKLCERMPYAYVVNNRFDELWVSVPVGKVEEARKIVASTVAEPWDIGGKQVVFQIDPPNCEVRYAPGEEVVDGQA
jgi:DNA polymerase I-like protein with 3'-5' exonuclease and polymerase domains